jgi:hypothetical protein
LDYYHSDPFFKAKLDCKLAEIEKWFKTKSKTLCRPQDLLGLKADAFSLRLDVNQDLTQIEKQYFYLKDLIAKTNK